MVCWTMALPEERLIEISPTIERLFGYQPADFRQRPELWDELVHPADRERVHGEFRAGIAARRPFEIAFTGLHRDHHDLPELVNRRPGDGRRTGDRCEGFLEDLNAAKTLERTLRQTRSDLNHTLDAVSSAVLVVRPDETGPRIAVCNRRLSEMLHLDMPIVAGTPLASAPPELRRLVYGAESEGEFQRRLLSDEVRDETAELSTPHRVLRRYAGPLREHGRSSVASSRSKTRPPPRRCSASSPTRRRWRAWDGSPAASRTTSIICSERSSDSRRSCSSSRRRATRVATRSNRSPRRRNAPRA
jgi:PAS domain-containing protein